MTNEQTMLRIIATSEVFKRPTYGILREYFPKATIWKLLDSAAPKELIQDEAIEFYRTIYWYRLKLDLVNSDLLQELMFNFATLEGQNKLVAKLSKGLGIDAPKGMSLELIEAINLLISNPSGYSKFTKSLLLELIEFYDYTKNPKGITLVLKYYRAFRLA